MVSRPPRHPLPRFLAAVVALLAAVWCAPATAQTDLGVERRLIEELIRDGKYKQVVAETRQLEQIVRPNGRPPKGGQQTAIMIDLLLLRMFAEREMGMLSDAEKSLTDAQRYFKSKDFQRALAASVPRSSDAEQVGKAVLPFSLLYFSLIDEEAMLLLERVRSDNHGLAVAKPPRMSTAAGTAETDATEMDAAAWAKRFELLDNITKIAQHARNTSLARLPDGEESPESRSPYIRAMLGGFRPRLLTGKRFLEAGKLPFTLVSDTVPPAAEDEPVAATEDGDATSPAPVIAETPAARAEAADRQFRRAIEYLEQAVADADAACDAALAAFERDEDELETADYLAARKEAARIRCAAKEALAEAVLRHGDPERARQILGPAIADLRAAEKPNHPALAEPLIVDAEISLAEMRQSIAAKNVTAAERQSRAAVEALREAKELLTVEESGFDKKSPIHELLAATLAQAESQSKLAAQLVASKDAADAAARRALRAINAGDAKKAAPPPRKPAPAAEPQPTE
jgi:hypothetical protein